MIRFALVEYPTTSATASARFLEDVFGWRSVAYGPNYRDVAVGAGVSLGFQADASEAPAKPLVVLEVDDLEAMRERVTVAGGVITVEPFEFPGGWRMQFREPGGNELAVYVPSQGD